MQRNSKRTSQPIYENCVTIHLAEEYRETSGTELPARQDTISQGSTRPLMSSNTGKIARLLTSLTSLGSHKKGPATPLTVFTSLPNRPQRRSSTSKLVHKDSAERSLRDLLSLPLCHRDYHSFRTYFGRDISGEEFDIPAFYSLFELKKTYGERLLRVFGESPCIQANTISGSSVIRIAKVLSMSTMLVKALLLFKIFDFNDDGTVTVQEMTDFYEKHLKEIEFPLNGSRLEDLTAAFLNKFYRGNINERLDFDRFYSILEETPSLTDSLLLINLPENDDQVKRLGCMAWLTNNFRQIFFIVVYILANIGVSTNVVITQVVDQGNQNGLLVVAHVAGCLIKLNFVLSITLMLKQCMGLIRRQRWLRWICPVDDHIDGHRYIGVVLAVCGVVHTLAHTINYAIHTNEYSFLESMFTTARGQGWVMGSAPITGVILLALFAVMFIFALQCIRNRPGFYKLFFYSHLLFWPIFILLVIHSREFWKWICGPMFLFVCEKVYSLKRYLARNGRTRLISVKIEDKSIISLTIKRPKRFYFKTGDYVNICLPDIASFEWHPFSISSCPENKEYLRIHMKKHQNWTKKVYEYFYRQCQVPNPDGHISPGQTASTTIDGNPADVIFPLVLDSTERIWIDGPYGSSTSYMFDCDHVVFIAPGIGITPYASALDSLMHRFRANQSVCRHCQCVNHNHAAIKQDKPKKVDIIWTNPNIDNFSWFLKLFENFENEQLAYLGAAEGGNLDRQRLIEFHLYFTRLQSTARGMVGHAPYELFSRVCHNESNQDILTTLKTKTIAGKPQWALLFAKFKTEHKKTDVFFTGNPDMGKDVKRFCDEYGFTFHHEPYL